MAEKFKKYVIGVDGGGTKTTIALADFQAKILSFVETGPSNPRNVGILTAAKNIAEGINKILKEEKTKKNVFKKGAEITSIFAGLPAIGEEYKSKKSIIKKEISKRIPRKISSTIKIGSDQIVAFRAGTDKKEGVVLIAGTGFSVHGWKKGKEVKSSGWGWLADEGSAFWTGQRVLRATLKDIDKRLPKNNLTKLVLRKFKIKEPEELIKEIYQKDFIKKISSLSVLCGKEAEKANKTAVGILEKGAEEAGLSFRAVISGLKFKNKKFPVVLIGSMFESKVFLKKTIFYIKKTAPEAQIILLGQKPVIGAVKLAIEN